MEVLANFINICGLILSNNLVYGIVSVESSGQPLVINHQNATKQFKNKAEAVQYTRTLLDNNERVDMGLGQINSTNLSTLDITVDEVFDTCVNLQALQTVFLWGYDLPQDKHLTPQQKEEAALSRYNTGSPTRGIDNGYVARVREKQAIALAPTVTLADQTKETPRGYNGSSALYDDSIGGYLSVKDGYSDAVDAAND